MKRLSTIRVLCTMLLATFVISCHTLNRSLPGCKDAFGRLGGTLVLIDCSSGRTTTYRPDVANTALTPCSTFKIVNALIGIEVGIVTSSQQSFYQWDGVERSIPSWNQDLTFREAFQASCVPAFQNLARQIGSKRMQSWIDKFGYGDRNISSGIEVFWLPSKGRQTILISPMGQARMIRRIIAGDVPFSIQTLALLKKLMFIKKTSNGSLYGKTGSGTDKHGTFVLGWFVGYVESKGKTYAFACTTQGKNTMSKDARAIVEQVFEKKEML